MTRHFFKIALGCAFALAAVQMPAGAQDASDAKLTVWWVKGFYKSEDDALFEAIRKFGEVWFQDMVEARSSRCAA